jgi:hypothetical protein
MSMQRSTRQQFALVFHLVYKAKPDARPVRFMSLVFADATNPGEAVSAWAEGTDVLGDKYWARIVDDQCLAAWGTHVAPLTEHRVIALSLAGFRNVLLSSEASTRESENGTPVYDVGTIEV